MLTELDQWDEWQILTDIQYQLLTLNKQWNLDIEFNKNLRALANQNRHTVLTVNKTEILTKKGKTNNLHWD